MDKGEASKLGALSDITSIDITLEFDRSLNNILKITCEAMNARSGTIMLVDEETGELRKVASYGLPDDYPERVHETARMAGVKLTSSPSGTVLATGKHYLVPDFFKEPRGKPWYGLSREFGFSSIISTPMKRGMETTGLLNVYWADPRQFTDDEINFVTIAASQASSVVQNARMCNLLKNNNLELNGYKERLEEKIKEAHRELKESEARYRDLFENANDPMYTIDTEGYFLTINNAGLRILGGTKEEVIGSHISRWLTPESLKVSQEILKKQVLGEPWEQPVIIEVVCMNGEHKWGEVRTRAIKDGERVTGIHGIARDITEKRQMEQKLKEYHEKLEKSCEALKEADRTKTEFISNITHELFTPLTSVKGFAELIYDGTLGKINNEQKRSLEIILRNSDRLIRLIKELVDAAQLEKNKLGLQFGLVSINDILSRSVQDMHPQARDKQISIIQNVQPLPDVWGDEERLTQVMTNLIGNAIKFTPQKGTITITADEGTDEIKVSIIDTGIGIPEDKLTRIFERFYQIDSSTKRKYGGFGLGLSICRSIIEKHCGSIRAESNRNGSTFHIVLPKLTQIKGDLNV